MWKNLTASIEEETYCSLVNCRLFFGEQKGCHKGTSVTSDWLTHSDWEVRWKNVTMTWIDYKNQCYSPAILDYIMSKNVQDIRQSHKIHHESHENVESWIDSRRKILPKVKIQRAILQGNALSPWLFVIVMMAFTNILRKCNGGRNLRY